MLQAYQADLLKDLDKGPGLSPDEVAELFRTTDLALRATSVGKPGRYWEEREGFLLDAPVSPSELFGTSVETVVVKFR